MLLVVFQSPADPSRNLLCHVGALGYSSALLVTAPVTQCGPDRVFAQGFDG